MHSPIRDQYRSRLVHMGSQVLSPVSLEVNPCNLRCWEHGSWDLPLHTWFQILSPKYDMDAHMARVFEGEAWDLCSELGWGPGHIWLHTTLEGPWPHTTWFWRCLGMAFGHFLLDSHNFMVMALGSCAKWP